MFSLKYGRFLSLIDFFLNGYILLYVRSNRTRTTIMAILVDDIFGLTILYTLTSTINHQLNLLIMLMYFIGCVYMRARATLEIGVVK